jgi:y4mF family transcriptional regulator
MDNSNKIVAQSLGAAIRNTRKKLKLSQTEVADLAGVSLNYISQLETGKPKAQLDKLLDVLDVLGLELSLAVGKSKLSISKDIISDG